jgi:GntR family transcriptional regulator
LLPEARQGPLQANGSEKRGGPVVTSPGSSVTAVVRTVSTPYYLQIADILRAGLGEGKWEPGQLIPSEASLGEMFAVSRTAIRQALGQLVSEGLLHKEKGRGTFVARPHMAISVQELRGFFDEMSAASRPVTTEVLRQEVSAAPVAMAALLNVPVGASVVCIERLRSVATEPLVHATTYLPWPRFADLVDIDLRTTGLYAELDERYGVQPHGGLRRLEALPATPAQAKLLRVRSRDAVLRVIASNVDATGAPFEAFEAYYRGDRAVFEAVVRRADTADLVV